MSRTQRFGPLRFLALAALAAAVSGPSPARAQDAPPGGPGPREGQVQLVFGDDGMKVPDLLRAASAATGHTILWSPEDKAVAARRLQGPARLDVPREGLFDAVRSLLATQEVVLVPMGGAEGFWYALDARTLASQFILRMKATWVVVDEKNVGELEKADGLYVSTLLPVENLDNLRDARAAFQRLVTANNVGYVQEVPAARAFVVADFAPNVAAIWRVLQRMDVPTSPSSLRVASFKLAHAKALAVKALLDGLYPPRPAAPPGQEPAPGGPYAVADEASNQVFVRASAADLASIRSVIEAADVLPSGQ